MSVSSPEERDMVTRRLQLLAAQTSVPLRTKRRPIHVDKDPRPYEVRVRLAALRAQASILRGNRW